MTNEQQPMARGATGMSEPAAGPDSSASQARKASSSDCITERELDCMSEDEPGRLSNRTPGGEPNCIPGRNPKSNPDHMPACMPESEAGNTPRRMSAGKPKHPILRNARMLGNILRHTGFVHITAIFGVLFLFCSLMVWLADPGCLTFGDGMWFSFEAVSTIGFGDIEAAGPIARAATVVLSIFSVFYIALITGVVVNYCSNLIKARQKDTLANFVDSLEHLEEKTPEELAELSARVREYVAKR